MYYAPQYQSTPSHLVRHRKNDKTWMWIAAGVIFLHFASLGAAWIASSSPKREEHQKLIVKTVSLNPKPQSLLAPLTPPAPPAIEQKVVPTQDPVPEPVLEVKKEPLIPEKQPTPPPPAPASEAPVPKPQPEEIAPPPKPTPTTPPKKNTPAPVEKAKSKPPEKKEQPKAKPTQPPKTPPAPKKEIAKKQTNQAPVSKPAAAPKKPKVEAKKEPTAEELAAQERERIKQQELKAAQEAAYAKQQALLAKAKENIAKIGESRDKIGTAKIASIDATSIPKQLENLQIDALPVGTALGGELNAKEISYRDEVAYRLKVALRLPDYGAIKLKLTLLRSGKVASVEIINSESEKNKQYIERTVPTLIFTPFGSRFDNAAQYTFLISLNNA